MPGASYRALCAALSTTAALAAAQPPNLVMVLQDDLGYYDNAFNGNAAAANRTANVTKLAADGIVLTAHYVFYWCSPTRRSFLTGRLPLHHGEMLSQDQGDDIDLRWKLISQKLEPKGYVSYWFGKGHTGYKSMAHLPTQRGFKNFTGFLGGMQSYTASQRWQNSEPLNDTAYSTNLYGEAALTTLESHDTTLPLFLYLPWQAVHSPYDPVPFWTQGTTYHGMLWLSDCYIGKIRKLLEDKNMYNNTLIVYSADNGGRGDGINFPLRGMKRTNYEGGMRVAAFVSGGLIPQHLRGTSSGIRFHIVDWYPTFCFLAGVDPTDNSPIPPLPIDPSNPNKDIYGSSTWPGIDGKNIWNALIDPDSYNTSAIHPTLVLSREVLIKGKYKILTSQHGNTHQGSDSFENRWQAPNGTWYAPKGWKQTCGFSVYGEKATRTVMKPCVFDLETDKNETTDLADANPGLLTELWTELNNSWLGYFHSRSPDKLLGACNEECARAYWHRFDGRTVATQGPICGVDGCAAGPSPAPPGPVPPLPHYPPVNQTNCTYAEALQFNSRVPDRPKGVANVHSREACCRACFLDVYCVVGAWHESENNGNQGNKCYLHYSMRTDGTKAGVTACITGRA